MVLNHRFFVPLIATLIMPFASFGQKADTGSSPTAREERPKDIANFTGVVQFVGGQPQWKTRPHRDTSEPIQFKTFLHYGDVIELDGSEDYVKIIPESRCVGVAYGPGELKAPARQNDVWKISEEASLRWICDEKESETLTIAGDSIKLSGKSEIFYHDEEVLIRHGRVLASQGELKPNHLYEHDDGRWELEQGPDRAYEQWMFNSALPAPKESLSVAKPEKPVRSRWALTPGFGPGGMKHTDDRFNIDNLEYGGFRLLSNFKYDERSILASISFMHGQNSHYAERDQGPNTTPEDPNGFNELEMMMLELGQRWDHQRNWSWFTKFGIGHLSYRNHAWYQDIQAGLDHKINYLAGSVSMGVDRTFFTKWTGWGGIYVSAEAFFRTTLIHLDTKYDSNGQDYLEGNPPPGLEDYEGRFMEVGVMFFFGPLLEF